MKAGRILSAVLGAAVAAGMMCAPAAAENTAQKLDAFPGAEGGGRYTLGARGAETVSVYHVTNLNDSGSGSLRDAVSQPGRIVVFDISGIIELDSKLTFNAPYITVLGQTAPGDGITITGYDAEVKADNIILRYLRIRPTDNRGGEPDGLGGRWVHDIVLDHCSVSWGVDEMLTLYAGSLEKEGKEVSRNITVQYCLSAESLRMSNHIKGAHGYGGIVGGTNATYHHNLFAHHDSRNPRFDRNLKSTDFVNNVIYDWGNNSAYGAEPYSYNKQEQFSTPEYVSNINIRNNAYRFGPSTKDNIRSKIFEATNDGKAEYNGEMLKTNAYINGNCVSGNDAATRDNTASEEYVMNRDKLNLLDAPVDMGEYTINMQSAEEAFSEVLDNVGATLPRRDAIDARIVSDVTRGTGRIINREEEVGGLTGIESETRVFEIPAEWKAEHGMGNASETDRAPSGYTWIEEYVNYMTAQHDIPRNPIITVEAPATASTEKTYDLTGNRGFWTISKEGQPVKYKASAYASKNISIDKIELYDGTEKITETEGGSIDYDMNLAPGAHYITSKAYSSSGEKTTSDTSIIYVKGAGAKKTAEIGITPYSGEGAVWEKDGKTYIGGSGKIGGTSDSVDFDMHYTSGDFTYTAKIEDIPKFENGALNGIMFRESMDSDSRMIMISDGWKKYGENITVPYRLEKGGELEIGWLRDAEGKDISNSDYDIEKNPLPKYMKIERRGDTLTVAVSDDGADWTNNTRQPRSFDISGWSKNAYVGLAVDASAAYTNECSPNLPWYAIASFSDIKTEGVYDSRFKAEYKDGAAAVSSIADITVPVIFAAYDKNGTLIAASTVNAELKAGENTVTPASEVSGATVKVYIP